MIIFIMFVLCLPLMIFICFHLLFLDTFLFPDLWLADEELYAILAKLDQQTGQVSHDDLYRSRIMKRTAFVTKM